LLKDAVEVLAESAATGNLVHDAQFVGVLS
jgi:hypothetical protein